MTNITPIDAGPETQSVFKPSPSAGATTVADKKQILRSVRNKPDTGALTGDSTSQVEFTPVSGRKLSSGRPDRALVERAQELLDDIESADVQTMALAIESLRYVSCELWTSVSTCSQAHQSVLAQIETLVIPAQHITAGQAVALRGAFKDLGGPVLSESHVDVIRSRFVDEGQNPLAGFSGVGEVGAENGETS